jgi:hypothetical protein
METDPTPVKSIQIIKDKINKKLKWIRVYMDSVLLNFFGNKIIVEKIYQKILPIILKNYI